MRDRRPAPLPTHDPAPAAGAAGAPRGPVPAGAARWATIYLDTRGVPVRSEQPIPVDANDRPTGHVRHTCRHTGKVKDGTGNLAKTRCGQETWLRPGQNAPYCPEHGGRLEPDEKTASPSVSLPWSAMWSAIEPAARPAWLLAAQAAAGIGEQVWQVNPAWPAASVPMLAACGYATVRGYLTVRARRRGRGMTGRRLATLRRRARAGAYLGAASGGWLTVAAATDPHTPTGMAAWAMLPVLWAAGAAGWWRRQARLRRTTPQPAPVEQAPDAPAAPVDGRDPQALADATAWAQDVAADTVGLKTTQVDVDSWQADPGGRRMVVRAARGAITDATLQQALPSIAGAFGVPSSAVGFVTEHEGTPRSALLLIQPNSPLNENVPGQPVDVVDVDDAVATMGLRIDGSPLVTRLWTPGWGAPSRIFLGTKGSGKTETVRLLLLQMTLARILRSDGTPTRLVAPFLHDPKRLADYGLFKRAMCGVSVDSDTLHMIVDAVTREMNRRYDTLAGTVWRDEKGRCREGEKPWDPATMGPVISLFCDEFHDNAKDQALLDKMEPMGRKMRAAGIEINVATHAGTISDTGSQVMRDMLAGGEAWLLRTTNGLNAALATGGQLVGDPRALPRIPGMLLQASGEGQTMQSRSAYIDSETMYDLLYDEHNEPLFSPVDWPAETLDAFGSEFVDWMDACQNRPLGAPLPGVPAGLRDGQTGAEPASAAGGRKPTAEETLRTILLTSDRTVSRQQVTDHPLWSAAGYNGGATLTAAARAGEDAGWLVRPSGTRGVYAMPAAVRDRLLAEAAEELAAA